MCFEVFQTHPASSAEKKNHHDDWVHLSTDTTDVPASLHEPEGTFSSPLDLNKIAKLLSEHQERATSCEGSDVVLLLGDTGNGVFTSSDLGE